MKIVIKVVLFIFAAILVVVGYGWQRNFIPHAAGVSSYVEFWHGLIHGLYVIPNYFVNLLGNDTTLEIYQAGAGALYQFLFLLGFSVLIGGLCLLSCKK